MKKKKIKLVDDGYMYCRQCGGTPIKKVDNAKEYVCWKCLIKFLEERTKWKMKKTIELFKKLVSEIDIKKYNQEEYVKIINLIYLDIFRGELNGTSSY